MMIWLTNISNIINLLPLFVALVYFPLILWLSCLLYIQQKEKNLIVYKQQKREKNLFINNILIHLNKLKQTIRPACLSVFVAMTHKVGVVVTICVCFYA